MIKMEKYRKILFVLLFAGISLSVSPANVEFLSNPFPVVEEQQDETMSVEILINGTTKITMENVPTTGYLEVYSILGVRIKSINLETCIGGCYIDLPKGIYILKAGKVAQKIIVR
jgi:hypothetical protein